MHTVRQSKAAAKADALQRARQVTVVLVLVTVGLSVSSVSYLGGIVRSRRAGTAGAAGHDAHDWHDVLHRVEHKLESHLPHQVADELALPGVGQRPQGESCAALHALPIVPDSGVVMYSDIVLTTLPSRLPALAKMPAISAWCHHQKHTTVCVHLPWLFIASSKSTSMWVVQALRSAAA